MMCGDGANDCTALKTADAGISLADSEASIAAPFTSKVQDISCVPKLLMEGRGCLEATILSLRFIEFYAIAEGMTIACLFYIGTNMVDWQYLYIDLFLVFPMTILQCYTKSSDSLTPQMPSASMLTSQIISTTVF